MLLRVVAPHLGTPPVLTAPPLPCPAHAPRPPCPAGRGPLQISYNYNYGLAGAALGLPLLARPELVLSDAVTSWKTALWWVPRLPLPAAH